MALLTERRTRAARGADGMLYPADAVAAGDAGAAATQQALLPASQQKVYRDGNGLLQLRTTGPADEAAAAASEAGSAAGKTESTAPRTMIPQDKFQRDFIANQGEAGYNPAVQPGAGGTITAAADKGLPALNLSTAGKATNGYGINEANRLRNVAMQDASAAFSIDKAQQDKLNSLRTRAADVAGIDAGGPSSKAMFDQSFVGKASMSNPSFRNAMAAKTAYEGGVAGRARQLTQLNSELASVAGERPVGGQLYQQQALGTDQAKANIDKTIAEANLAQATAASGGKGAHTKDTSVSDIADLAKADPEGAAVATNNLAALKKGGTGKSYTVDVDGKPRTYSGIMTADQQAALDTDAAALEASKAKASKWHGRLTNWATGARRDYDVANAAFQKKLINVARPNAIMK